MLLHNHDPQVSEHFLTGGICLPRQRELQQRPLEFQRTLSVYGEMLVGVVL
jgi:hypothetical protein